MILAALLLVGFGPLLVYGLILAARSTTSWFEGRVARKRLDMERAAGPDPYLEAIHNIAMNVTNPPPIYLGYEFQSIEESLKTLAEDARQRATEEGRMLL